jgi:DNA-directed RNA polymerase subunit F
MVNEISRRPLTVHEAKDLLLNIDVEKADQIQKRTLDYVMKFSKIDGEKAKILVQKLVKETGLTEIQAVEVVNVMPKSREELRTFTVGWRQLTPTEVLDKMLEILNSSSEKKGT